MSRNSGQFVRKNRRQSQRRLASQRVATDACVDARANQRTKFSTAAAHAENVPVGKSFGRYNDIMIFTLFLCPDGSY